MKKYFQPARVNGVAWNIAKTLLQSAVFWALFLAVIPIAIHQLESRAGIPQLRFGAAASESIGTKQLASGWIMFALCGSLGLTSGITMAVLGSGTPLPLDTARKLVVRGPFRWVRNPMAVAGIGQGIAVGVILGSWSVVLYSLAGALIWHRWVRPHEEADLLDRFGDDYRRYQENTGLWIPKLRRRN